MARKSGAAAKAKKRAQQQQQQAGAGATTSSTTVEVEPKAIEAPPDDDRADVDADDADDGEDVGAVVSGGADDVSGDTQVQPSPPAPLAKEPAGPEPKPAVAPTGIDEPPALAPRVDAELDTVDDLWGAAEAGDLVAQPGDESDVQEEEAQRADQAGLGLRTEGASGALAQAEPPVSAGQSTVLSHPAPMPAPPTLPTAAAVSPPVLQAQDPVAPAATGSAAHVEIEDSARPREAADADAHAAARGDELVRKLELAGAEGAEPELAEEEEAAESGPAEPEASSAAVSTASNSVSAPTPASSSAPAPGPAASSAPASAPAPASAATPASASDEVSIAPPAPNPAGAAVATGSAPAGGEAFATTLLAVSVPGPSAEQADAPVVQEAEDFFGALQAEESTPVEEAPEDAAGDLPEVSAATALTTTGSNGPTADRPSPVAPVTAHPTTTSVHDDAAGLFGALAEGAGDSLFAAQGDEADDLFGAPGATRSDFQPLGRPNETDGELFSQPPDLSGRESAVVDDADRGDDLFGGSADQDEAFLKDVQRHEMEEPAEAPEQATVSEPSTTQAADGDLFAGASGANEPFFSQNDQPGDRQSPLSSIPVARGPAASAAQSDDNLFGDAPPHSDPFAAEGEAELFGGPSGANEMDDILKSTNEPTAPIEAAPVARTNEGANLSGGRTDDADLFGASTQEPDWLGPGAGAPVIAAGPPASPDPPSSAVWLDEDLDRLGVPEGWLDETGGWNWYTEDERKEVAKGMGLKPPAREGNAPVASPAAPAPTSVPNLYAPPPAPPPTSTHAPAPPQNPYAPASQGQPTFNLYSPYAPLPSSPTYLAAPQGARTSSFVPAPPTPGITAPGFTSPAANPYAPVQPAYSASNGAYGQPSISPYGPASAGTSLGVSAPAPQPAAMPVERPKQNTAYDPPFLAAKVPRSLSRVPSVAPMLHGIAPSPLGVMSGMPSPANNPAPPPPPPAAPPRGPSRQGSPAVSMARQPSFARPPARTFDPPMPPMLAARSRSAAPAASPLQFAPPPQSPHVAPGQVQGSGGSSAHPYGPPSRAAPSFSPQQPMSDGTRPPPSRPPPTSRQVSYAPRPAKTSPPPDLHSQHSSREAYFPPPAPSVALSPPPPPPALPPQAQLGPPTRAPHDVAAELGDDEPVSTGRLRSSGNDNGAAEEVGWPQSDPNLSPSYDTTIDSVEDMFDPDEPRQASSAASPARALENEDDFDPEGGAPLEDDYDEEPLGQSNMSSGVLGEQRELYTKLSPPRSRPSITPSTFAVPRTSATHDALGSPTGGDRNAQPSISAPVAHIPSGQSTYGPYSPAVGNAPWQMPPATNRRTSQIGPYSPGQTRSYLPGHGSNADPIDNSSNAPGFGAHGYAGTPQTAPAAHNNSLPIPQPFLPLQQSETMYGPVPSSSYEPPSSLDMLDIADDPLRRQSATGRRMPCIAFGPRGQILSSFPSTDADKAPNSLPPGYGSADSSRCIAIRRFSDVVPLSAISSETALFPGPLVFETGVGKGSAGDKKKKEQVLAYIAEAIQEIEAGLPYLAVTPSTAAKRAEQQARVILLEIAKLMIMHEGKVPVSESTGLPDLRTALLRSTASVDQGTGAGSTPAGVKDSHERTSPITSIEASTLSDLLLGGDQSEAANFALNAGLWSHALVIASSVGPELWKTTVERFTTATLSSAVGEHVSALQLVYGLYAGSGETAIATAMPASTKTVASDWQRTLLAVLTNHKPGDSSALLSLGEKLQARGQIAAAHACYLLSSQVTPASPAAAQPQGAILYGHPPSSTLPDSSNISELIEYAISLPPVPKGREVFAGMPHLLAYKISKAFCMLETGQIANAERYVEAVNVASKSVKSPAVSVVISTQLRELASRLAPESKSPDTLLRKVGKPNLDSLGSWFEGRLTKFIAGEEDQIDGEGESKAVKPPSKAAAGEIGPFSHYSAITSNQGEGQLSRAVSTYDLGDGYQRAQGGSRPSSATGSRNQLQPFSQAPPSSAQSNPLPYAPAQSAQIDPPWQPSEVQRPSISRRESATSDYGEQIQSKLAPAVDMPSWGTSYDFGESADMHTDEAPGEYINPMMAYNPNPVSAAPLARANTSSQATAQEEDFEDDDDLGLGNASSRNKTPRPDAAPSGKPADTAKPAESPKVTPAQADTAKTASGRWGIGRWFSKTPESGSPTGPIKAKLGNENAMVYDKELKRWVAKGGAPPEAIKPPPPPPRAQTASPASVPATKPALTTGTAPPARTQSVAPGPPPPSGAPPLRHQKSALPLGGPPSALSAADVAAELMAGPRKTGTGASKKKPRYVAID